MGFSQQEYWSVLPFPPPMDHILSELSTVNQRSCMALHGMAHSFIELASASTFAMTGSDPFLCEFGDDWWMLLSSTIRSYKILFVWTLHSFLAYFYLLDDILESRSVMSSSLQPHGLYSSWNSPGQNTGMDSRSLFQGIFPTQRSNAGFLHCRRILDQLSDQGSQYLKVYTLTIWFPIVHRGKGNKKDADLFPSFTSF